MRFRVGTWHNTETEKPVYVIEAREGRGKPWAGVIDTEKVNEDQYGSVLGFDHKPDAIAMAAKLNAAAKEDGNYSG